VSVSKVRSNGGPADEQLPLLAGAYHYAISATVTADPDSPAGAFVGDLLVQPVSAHGRRGPRQHTPFPVELGRGLDGMHHLDLSSVR
jgi:hypothetical protein